MDAVLDRIFETMKARGKKNKELAEYLGLSPQRVTDWKSGRIASYSKHVDKIAAFLGVSTDYLLTGQGADILGMPGVFPVAGRRVPLLGEIACGEPIYAEEEHEMTLSVGSDVPVDFALRAKAHKRFV